MVIMRLDKFLKVSRIIKRRTVANEACDTGRVKLNDKVAKAGAEVKVGDIVEIKFGENWSKFEILRVSEVVKKDDATEMYKLL
jgi:ribosomal 50S subunit-recycling heat shock protein